MYCCLCLFFLYINYMYWYNYVVVNIYYRKFKWKDVINMSMVCYK